MKKRAYCNTTRFSEDCEPYVASLFSMAINPNNSLRPDLISLNGLYKPKLTLEVKSGRAGRSILHEYQLAYPISTWDDYFNLVGENPPQGAMVLPNLDWKQCIPISRKDSPAFYYVLVRRNQKVKSKNIKDKLDCLRIEWGDQIIVPGNLIHYYFAVRRSERTGEKIDEVLKDINLTMRRNLTLEDFSERTRDYKRSTQPLEWKDMLAIFNEEYNWCVSKAKEKDHIRIRRLKELQNLCQKRGYLDKLKRIEIDGPNGTKIYILAEKVHISLFKSQLGNQVKRRKTAIEFLTTSRRETVECLEKMMKNAMPRRLFEDDIPLDPRTLSLPEGEIKKLESLCSWLLPGETHPKVSYKPDDDLMGENDLSYNGPENSDEIPF